MIINIVLDNGWNILVREDAEEVWEEILDNHDGYIEVTDIHGRDYLVKASRIVVVKDLSNPDGRD